MTSPAPWETSVSDATRALSVYTIMDAPTRLVGPEREAFLEAGE